MGGETLLPSYNFFTSEECYGRFTCAVYDVVCSVEFFIKDDT